MIRKGYFPRELSPYFHAGAFAAAVPSLEVPPSNEWTAPATYNLSRPGNTLRRRLDIVNPFSQLALSDICGKNWTTLNAFYQQSPVSMSRPLYGFISDRAVRFRSPYSAHPAKRLEKATGARYTVVADISDFYGSIYTHSIEWALDGKAAAKANLRKRGPKSLAQMLDKAVREGQEGQTKGIPIGPDTSLILSELILCSLDARLMTLHPGAQLRCMRFMDDLEYSARSRAEAEDVLLSWDKLLRDFHLSINPEKTRIQEGPLPPEDAWRAELAQFAFRENNTASWLNDLHSFASRAIELAKINPGKSVLSYAIRRIKVPTESKQWTAYCHFLLVAAVADPSSIQYVVKALRNAASVSIEIDYNLVGQALNELCIYHAPLEHGYEVSWALSGLRKLDIEVDSSAAESVAKMSDSCSLILIQDLIKSGRVGFQKPDLSMALARAESETAPSSEDWLLGYEFARNGWCSDRYYRGNAQWKELLDRDIEFYRSADGVEPDEASAADVDPTDPPADAEDSTLDLSYPG